MHKGLFFLAVVISMTSRAEDAAPRTWTVSPGQSIQAKMEQAASGDTIQILPGKYNESIVIEKDGLVLIGLEYEGEYAVFDGMNMGGGFLEVAVKVTAENTRLEGLHIENYTEAGIIADGVIGLYIGDARIARCGRLGIAVTDSRDVLIERSIVRDAADTGFSLRNVQEFRIASSEAYSNRIGVEVVDCLKGSVFDSTVHRNAAGVVLRAEKPEGDAGTNADHINISYCRVVGNGEAPIGNAKPEELDTYWIPGVGIYVAGFDHAEIAHCYLESNDTYGVLVEQRGEGEEAIRPNHAYVHHNHYGGNGERPSGLYLKRFGEIPAGDIYWDENGERNQFQEGSKLKTWPENLVIRHGGVHTDVMHFL